MDCEKGKKLADEHWGYLQNLLRVHEIEEGNIITLGFHYKTAFIHGYKHGVEDTNDKTKEN